MAKRVFAIACALALVLGQSFDRAELRYQKTKYDQINAVISLKVYLIGIKDFH